MYRVRGWIALEHRADGGAGHVDRRRVLETMLAQLRDSWGVATKIEVHDYNLDEVLFLHTNNNHDSGRSEELKTFLNDLGRWWPGSYGVVYEYTDDLDESRWNAYRVLVMVRGVVTDHPDPYFSPIQPTIEDWGGDPEDLA